MSQKNHKLSENDETFSSSFKARVTKEEANRLMAMPGKVRGAVILANLEFAVRKSNKNIIDQIEQKLKELGLSSDLKTIKPMDKYSEAFSVIIILLIKEILNLTDNDIFEMGQAALKLPYFVKMISKYFVSLENVLEQSPKHWQKYFDFGKVEISQYDKEKNYVIIRVTDYKFHPIVCIYHRGYFAQAGKMATGKKVIESREIKCIYKGDPYHEYFISWK